MTAKPILEQFDNPIFYFARLRLARYINGWTFGRLQWPANSPSKAFLTSRRRSMKRAIKRPAVSLHSERCFDSSDLVLSRIKTPGQTVTIYCVGKLGLDEMLTRLPDLFLQEECKTIKMEKKIRVVRLPLRIGWTIKSVYVKQHNALSFRHRLASLFCASAALRSLSGAVILLQEGYATARPIAAVEYRHWGLLIKSFYISEEVAAAKTIADHWRENLGCLTGVEGRLKKRVVLRKLARLFKSLHEQRIYHNDLKASNVLVLDGGSTSEESFSLIDLQGVRKCFYVSKRRRIKNLAQINRTLGSHLSQTEKLCFIKAYAGNDFSDQGRTRRLVRSTLAETSRQIAKGIRRQRREVSIR